MDVALELAQDAKQPMPLAGLVDRLVKSQSGAHEGAAAIEPFPLGLRHSRPRACPARPDWELHP
jgi:hypothetical protein